VHVKVFERFQFHARESRETAAPAFFNRDRVSAWRASPDKERKHSRS
jgi:hypothetical protein